MGFAIIHAVVIGAGYGESCVFGNAERHGARLSYGLRTILRCVSDNAGYVVVISTYIRRSCSSCCSCRPSAGSFICFHDICTDNVIVFISDSVSDIYIVVLFTICKDVSLEHFFELIFDGKAFAVVGLAVFVRSAETIDYAYRNRGIIDRCNLFSFKSYVCTDVCRLSAAIGLSAIYGDIELYNELLAEVIICAGMFGFGYVVFAVVKAAYGDCTIFNFNSCAGEGGSLAKVLAVIVCGEDFNGFGTCRNLEVRRDIIRQDGSAAKGNAGLADGFAKLSKYAAERVCIACDFVEAFCYVSGAGVLHAACFRIVGRDKVHVAIGSSVVVIGRKRLTYACPIENTNGIYRCAVGLILESFCLIYCSLCYSSIKAVVVIRFTIGKHNHNTIAVFRHLASSTKYIDCFFKAVVSRGCAAGCERVY